MPAVGLENSLPMQVFNPFSLISLVFATFMQSLFCLMLCFFVFVFVFLSFLT